MHLVDDHLVPVRRSVVVLSPIKVRIDNDGVADRTCYILRIRIETRQLLRTGENNVSVLIAGLGAGNVRRPIAISIGCEGMALLRPIVEGSSDKDSRSKGRPNAKGSPAVIGNGAHAGVGRR